MRESKVEQIGEKKDLKSYLKLPWAVILVCVYIAIIILLPGGTVFGFNFKILVFVPLLLLAVRDVMGEKDGAKQLSRGMAIIVALFFWVFLAQIYSFYDIAMSLSQYKDVATTLIGCWLVRLFTRDRRDRDIFIRLCLYATAFLGFVKIAIFCYSLITGISIASLMDGISHAFGVQLMTIDLEEALGRIQFPSDTLVPVCLFTILCLRKHLKVGAALSVLMVACLLASSVFSFSRFLWGFTALGAVLGILVSKRDKMHWLYLGLSAVVASYYFTAIVLVVQLRFSQQLVDYSDSDRVLQKSALQRFFVDAPLFGHGFGSFTNVVIRQADLPYNYEMQLLALSTQIGIVGMIFLTCLLVNLYTKAFTFSKKNRAFQTAVLLLLAGFLSGALFNPSVVSSIAAATFGMLFALGSLESYTEQSSSTVLLKQPRATRHLVT